MNEHAFVLAANETSDFVAAFAIEPAWQGLVLSTERSATAGSGGGGIRSRTPGGCPLARSGGLRLRSLAVTIMALLAPLGLLASWSCEAADGPMSSSSLAIATRSLAPGQAEPIHSFAEGENPEGIAIDRQGHLYVSLRGVLAGGVRSSSVVKIDPQEGTLEVLVTLDEDVPLGLEGALGVVVDSKGDVYVALVSGDPTTHGVWRIDPDGSAMRLPGSETIAFPNALTFDARGNLYVTNTVLGEVWRFPNGEGPGEVWIQDPALADPGNPLLPAPIGANGIAFAPPRTLYVANTEGALLAEIPIEPDGSPGALRVVAQGFDLLTIDGIAVDVNGDVYAVIAGAQVLGNDPLVRIDPGTGEVVSLTNELAAFDTPTSLAFGTGGKTDRKSVYVVNAALRGGLIPQGSGPGIVQVGVGEPGLQGH
jgi:sugar lactone lactonase YvrE